MLDGSQVRVVVHYPSMAIEFEQTPKEYLNLPRTTLGTGLLLIARSDTNLGTRYDVLSIEDVSYENFATEDVPREKDRAPPCFFQVDSVFRSHHEVP
jgi:hypothetical protein